jgi:hypothetical protein
MKKRVRRDNSACSTRRARFRTHSQGARCRPIASSIGHPAGQISQSVHSQLIDAVNGHEYVLKDSNCKHFYSFSSSVSSRARARFRTHASGHLVALLPYMVALLPYPAFYPIGTKASCECVGLICQCVSACVCLCLMCRPSFLWLLTSDNGSCSRTNA